MIKRKLGELRDALEEISTERVVRHTREDGRGVEAGEVRELERAGAV